MFLLQRRLLMSTGVAALAAATVAVSDAETLAGSETDALAMVFTDDHFQATSGFYGSVYTVDSGTPANDYDNSPILEASSYLTYTSPSVKNVLHADGELKYAAHNLYLNSASPANQAITVVSGATYAVTITGSVSVTASGAATGTWTAGTNTFTAATTTLTLGSTSGSGTVHVRRTPSDSTYMETAGSARVSLPIEFNSSGTSLGLLVEPQRTNLALYASDLTNAAWSKSNMTTAKTATGPGGVANTATTCTATAGNATVTQAITSSSAARVTSAWIKRRTGTGNIDLTQDNGATWTTVAVDGDWQQLPISSVTSANPTIGMRIVTSGDAVDVAFFQHELGSSASSPIETFGSTVTRAADDLSLATSAFPFGASAGTMYVAHVPRHVSNYYRVLQVDDTTNNEQIRVTINSGTGGADVVDGGSDQVADGARYQGSLAVGTLARTAISYAANDFAISTDGNAAHTDNSGTIPTVTTLRIGTGNGGSNVTHGHIQAVLVLPTNKSASDIATLTSTGALP